MGIKRLNHAVLYVSDVRQSADFYHQVLGFKLKPSDSPDRAVFTRPPIRTTITIWRCSARTWASSAPGSFAPTTSRRRSMSQRPGCTIWPGKWTAWKSWAHSPSAGRTRHSRAGRGSRRAQKHLWPRSGRAAVRGDVVYSAGVADRRGQKPAGSARWISPPRNGASPAGKRLGYGRRGAPTITALC
ncbi:VOC family protein [Serratia ureilytica]